MVGRLLDGRYQIRARIARGGMATVYLATDLRLERRVAVKVMHAHLADDAAFRDRFIQEARSAARLAHPNVVNVFDQGQDLGTAYLVMEYLQGITLRDLLGEYGRLTPEQTMDILEAVLAGLVAAHKAGIIHRDLKPENVLLADDGRIKLGDFGLARAATSSTASGQALLGTIAYLSPELVTRGIADTRSDVYAVGIMMYEMLTGEQPFKGEQPVQIAYQHANDSVPAPSLKNPGVPALLDDLTLWATARDPEDRPRDARAMLDQLFETQHLMHDAAPANRTATQRTAVLPSAASTRVLATADLAPSAPRRAQSADVVDRLRAATARAHRRGAWAFAAVLVAGSLAAGTGWYYGGGPGSTAVVPSVTGKSQDAANAALIGRGFRIGPADQAYSSRNEGVVTATRPSAGALLPPGATVSLVLSKGERPASVPSVKGRTVAAATAAVTAARLVVAGRIDRASTRAAGTVLRLVDDEGATIAPGTTLDAGTAVHLLVSTGPADAAAPTTSTDPAQ
ncbi:serine/threonine-protein kinase [Amnibacterium kyonggiense]|uniref:non-specific serine/threonine protein kinase n=2 Tax=Amnibacterium kyonggiense TaxID=595671 RepID=A0A4R7FKV5_9MICO|nr:serine/threonine-protein kinase [Amnibacterium kyonggiense]